MSRPVVAADGPGPQENDGPPNGCPRSPVEDLDVREVEVPGTADALESFFRTP